jgi:hypothetical protein
MPIPEDIKKRLGMFYAQIMNHELPLRLSTKFPLLDKTIYDQLVMATLKESLQLSESQLKQLSQLNQGFFQELVGDVDPAELLPVERYALRHELMLRNRDSIEGILEDGQLENWDLVSDVFDSIVAQGLTGMTPVKEYGLESPDVEQQVLADWKVDFFLRPEQAEALGEFASDYVRRARALLERYGEGEDAITALSPELKQRLDHELLQIQQETERNLLPLLDAEQRNNLRERMAATLRRFGYGRGAPVRTHVK